MKVLLDLNLSPRWCTVLEKHGHSCVHWSEVGDLKASDASMMEWARKSGHVVLTHDLDFGAILAATQAVGPSVIQLRTQDVLSPRTESLLAEVLRRYEPELAAGAIVAVDEARMRVHVLPLT